MAYDPTQAFTNPTFDRSEMELFLFHPKMSASSDTAYYVGDEIETMEYAIAVESEEKATIAQKLPTVTNKDGGMTAPIAYTLMKGNPAYDAIIAAGLLGKVNEEFEAYMLYGNIGVKQSGTLVTDAPFAQKAKAKITVSAIGGAGTEKISVTAELKTTGDIARGYMNLVSSTSDPNYDPDNRTWKTSAFVAVPGLDIGDLVIGGGAA